MSARATLGTGLVVERAISRDLGKLRRHDSRRHRYDPVADYHDKTRQEFAERCLRCEIAVSNCGQCDDSPVHTHRNAREPVCLPLDDVHHCADQDHKGEYGRKENKNLVSARAERLTKDCAFRQKLSELQDPEDAQQSKHPDYQEVAAARKNETYIARQYGEQVDEAIEAQRIPERAPHSDESDDVLDGENSSESPFCDSQRVAVLCGAAR